MNTEHEKPNLKLSQGMLTPILGFYNFCFWVKNGLQTVQPQNV